VANPSRPSTAWWSRSAHRPSEKARCPRNLAHRTTRLQLSSPAANFAPSVSRARNMIWTLADARNRIHPQEGVDFSERRAGLFERLADAPCSRRFRAPPGTPPGSSRSRAAARSPAAQQITSAGSVATVPPRSWDSRNRRTASSTPAARAVPLRTRLRNAGGRQRQAHIGRTIARRAARASAESRTDQPRDGPGTVRRAVELGRRSPRCGPVALRRLDRYRRRHRGARRAATIWSTPPCAHGWLLGDQQRHAGSGRRGTAARSRGAGRRRARGGRPSRNHLEVRLPVRRDPPRST